jgi:hypothetical protein
VAYSTILYIFFFETMLQIFVVLEFGRLHSCMLDCDSEALGWGNGDSSLMNHMRDAEEVV